MKFILSIGIPSSGRIATLNKNIEYLKYIILKNNIQNDVEIVISDTASTVNNFILSNYNLPFISYSYSKNNGLDKNIYTVIKKSSGKFIWLCQDHTKIYEESLLKILNIIKKNNDLKYIFASTKDNFQLDYPINKDNRLIGFRCVYLNTNIVEKRAIEKVYLKLLDEFNGSHVIFLHSILYILLDLNKNYILNKNFMILTNKNSIYKYFETDSEHKKFTWSNDLLNYLKIISFSMSMLLDIQNKFNLDTNLINKIYKKRDYSVQTVFKIGKLIIKSDQNKINYEKKILENVYNHPTFNKTDIFLLKILLNKNIFTLFCVKYFFLLEIYFFIFLPRVFMKKFYLKLLSLFK